MTLVSVTAVAAFDAVGSVLVVGLMIAPAATAYLLTDSLKWMLGLSVALGVSAAWIGCRLAEALDANYAGAISTTLGGFFLLTFLAAPQRGILAQVLRRRRQRRTFETTMLVVHLSQHEGTPAEETESRVTALPEHLRWTTAAVKRVVERALRKELIEQVGDRVMLTARGRDLARATLNSSP